MTSKEIITLTIAIIGAVLGLFNTWFNFKKNRLKLKVIPSNCLILTMKTTNFEYEQGVSIEILNLSSFPVTIAEIGFANFYFLTNKIKGSKSIPLNITNYSGYQLPYRIESKDSITFYLNKKYLERKDLFLNNKFVYARTACGKIFKGSNRNFRIFIKNLYA